MLSEANKIKYSTHLRAYFDSKNELIQRNHIFLKRR